MGYFVLVFLLGAVADLTAQVSPMGTADEVAGIFGYPKGRVILHDQTASARKIAGIDELSSFEYSVPDNTFAEMSVTLAKENTEQIALYKKILEIHLKFSNRRRSRLPLAKQITLKNGMTSLVGKASIGQGNLWAAFANIPQKKLDCLITIQIPTDPILVETPLTADYFKLITSDPPTLFDRLSKCLELSVENANK